MYSVKIEHFRSCYYRGDLDSEWVIENVKYFKTLKEAKVYVKNAVRGKKDSEIINKKSGCYASYFTGKTWVEENTGEERWERYMYTCEKVAA